MIKVSAKMPKTNLLKMRVAVNICENLMPLPFFTDSEVRSSSKTSPNFITDYKLWFSKDKLQHSAVACFFFSDNVYHIECFH